MRIFGFGSRAKQTENVGGVINGSDVGSQGRRDLLDRIAEFLLGFCLDVSPRNLVIAHAAFSGSSLGLARQIATRQREQRPITQDWLEDVISGDPEFADRQGEFDKITEKLDASLARFSDTAREASQATSNFGEEICKHVDAIEVAADVDPQALLAMTKAMLERTQSLEAEMRRSESEVATLRRSLERAKRDADLDHLTGLPNRRAFEAVLEREFRDARAALESLSIAICDIDKFKAINDNHGHDAGDRVIQAIAEVFARISGERCHVARHGGEEFVLLFRGLSPDEAKLKLDGARENFAQRHFVNRETELPIGHVTFSGGVANVFGFSDPRAALAAADQALYQAKDGGRNRICLAT